MARILFRASRFLLMAAPVGIMGPRLGGLLFIGIASFAVTSLQQEAREESKLEARIKHMPAWANARRAQGGPLLAAWQKWLLIWGSWGWKSEPLLGRSWFAMGRLVPSERSYMLIDDDEQPSRSGRLAVIALLAGLMFMPLAIIAAGWLGGGSLGVQAASPYRWVFDLTLILLAASYVVLTLLHEQIFLFTSVRISDPELEAIVPARALGELARIAQGADEIQLGVDENHVFFATDGAWLTTRRIDGQFPNYKQLIPEAFEYEVKLPREELLDVVGDVAKRTLRIFNGSFKTIARTATRFEQATELTPHRATTVKAAARKTARRTTRRTARRRAA